MDELPTETSSQAIVEVEHGLPEAPEHSGVSESERGKEPVSEVIDDGLAPLPDGFDDLAPLPTELDPTLPLHEEIPEDDDLAIPQDEELALRDEPSIQNDTPMDLDDQDGPRQGEQADSNEVQAPQDDAGQVELEEEGKEDDEDARYQILDIVRGLAGGKGDDDDDGVVDGVQSGDEQSLSVSESPRAPLSPVLGLPDDLPSDSELDPAGITAPGTTTPVAAELPWAETSAAAAARAARDMPVTAREIPVVSRRSLKVEDTSNSSAWRADTGGEEELVSVSEADESMPQKYKRKRGLDGKVIRASKQPRKRLDAQLGILRDGDKPPDKVAPRAKTLSQGRLNSLLKGKTSEMQLAPCIRPRYGRWGKCTQCVSKLAGDKCRFRHYRVFPLDPTTAEITGPGTFESTTLEEPMTPLPGRFNTELTEETIARIERAVAPSLLGHFAQELRHVMKHNPIHRPIDTAKHRSVCDFCASMFFGGFWFCRKCGREYCIQCERYFSNSNEQLRDSPWPLPDAARPRLHHCTRGPESELPIRADSKPRGRKFLHHRSDLQATSRYTKDEVVSNWLALVGEVLQLGDDFTVGERIAMLGIQDREEELKAAVREWYDALPAVSTPRPPFSDVDVEALYEASKNLARVDDPTSIKSLPFMAVDVDKLSNTQFDHLWTRGEPILVKAIGQRLKLNWSPDTFIRRFSMEMSQVIDCSTEKTEVMNVGQFFALFQGSTQNGGGADGERSETKDASKPDTPDQDGVHGSDSAAKPTGSSPTAQTATLSSTETDRPASAPAAAVEEAQTVAPVSPTADPVPVLSTPGPPKGSSLRNLKKFLKLNDWPLTKDFAHTYPVLYRDLSDAMPAPDFTSRNGVLNLCVHFPAGPTRPDFGPRMTSALASDESDRGKGTTRLHMGLTDSVDLLLHASQRENGDAGCAVWDIFRAEDADKIRGFLKAKYPDELYADPIHSQKFYLDSELRQELYDKYGVASFRIYQHQGQAVFIPAGCPNQVCNLANCISVTMDFVSTHNIRRCLQLSQDSGKDSFARAWKDDVLQMYNLMWYAWTNVRQKREDEKRITAAAKAEQEAREARLAKLRNGQSGFQPQLASHSSLLSPATSSVRDDPARPVSSPSGTSHSPSPATHGAAENAEQGTSTTRSVAIQEPVSKDKADESAAATPLDLRAETTADAPSVDRDAQRSLAQRLMEAVLAREPQPVFLEPSTVSGLHAQQQQQRRDSPLLVAMKRFASGTPEPSRWGEAVRSGQVMVDLVAARDMQG